MPRSVHQDGRLVALDDEDEGSSIPTREVSLTTPPASDSMELGVMPS